MRTLGRVIFVIKVLTALRHNYSCLCNNQVIFILTFIFNLSIYCDFDMKYSLLTLNKLKIS